MDGDAVAARVTTPANPLSAVTVTVEFPAIPTITLTVAGLAAIVKSWTMYVTVVECDRDALLPVTVTWTVVAELKLQESVALPDPVTLAGKMVHEVLLVLRLTTPAKPLFAWTEIVEIPGVPVSRVTEVGFAIMLKSVTVNVTVAE